MLSLPALQPWYRNPMLSLIVFLGVLVAVVQSRCPNSCSGHGNCGTSNICTCYSGWRAADCSQRDCPSGVAWADKAYAADFAHQVVECSNAGFCNRNSGTCQCLPGFTGSACQRSACPKDCSGHGICSPISDVSIYKGPDYDSSVVAAGDGRGVEYTNWDKDSIQLCECDDGYFGPDCSLVMCPKGDDPLTVNQNDRSISLLVQSTGSYDLEGIVGLQFMGASVPLSVTDPTSDSCTTALAFKGKFGHVTCVYTKINRLTKRFDLTFHSWPTFPKTNNLYSHDGNPSRLDFYCDLSQVTRFTTCTFSDTQANNIKEYEYCSNRGSCNFVTGACTCHEGFGGPACANATNMYNTGSNSLPGLEVNVNGLDYVSTALQLSAQKSSAPDFYFLQALANSETVFYVRGDGTVGINKLRTLSGGQTVSGGGLYVEEGGVTILGEGLNVYNADQSNAVISAASTYTGPLGNSYSALSISTQTSTPSQLLALEVAHQGQRRFTVRGDGHVQVRQAGMTVTGGVSIGSGGLRVTGGATFHSGGVYVQDTGAIVTGGVTIYTDGLKVIIGGMQVFAGGASVYSGGMKIAGGLSITGGGFYSTGGVSIGTRGLVLTGGATIHTRGLDVTGGVTVNSNGLRVDGGATIVSDGLLVTTSGATITHGGLYVASNGLTIADNGLSVTGGLTVRTGGAVITGGLTIRGAGVVIVTRGMTIGNGGLKINNDGLTVSNDGLVVSGGITVQDTGMRIIADGLQVTGGISVGSNGLRVTDGATVYSGNFISTGLRNVGNDVTVVGGLRIGNGLTVTGGTEIESAANVWSDRRLKTNLAPITDALSKVSKLQGVYFDWIQNEASGMVFDEKRHVGVIAQDVQSVLPEVVDRKGKEGKYLGVDYASMVPLLIEAIHDLDEHLSALHAALGVPEQTSTSTTTTSSSTSRRRDNSNRAANSSGQRSQRPQQQGSERKEDNQQHQPHQQQQQQVTAEPASAKGESLRGAHPQKVNLILREYEASLDAADAENMDLRTRGNQIAASAATSNEISAVWDAIAALQQELAAVRQENKQLKAQLLRR